MNSIEGYEIANRIKKRCHDCRCAAEYAQALHIEIITRPLGNIKGMYTYAQRFRTILLNEKLTGYEKEFITFHEIGHDQIPEHRKLAKNGAFQEIQLFSNTTDKTELEANIIAAHLYIKEEELREYLGGYYTLDQIASAVNAPEDLVLIKLEQMKATGRFTGNIPTRPDPLFLREVGFGHDPFIID